MGLGKRRSRSVERRFVRRRINLYSGAPAVTVAPSTNSRRWMIPVTWGRISAMPEGRGPPGQFGRQGDRLRTHGVDDDLRRGWCWVGGGCMRAVARG